MSEQFNIDNFDVPVPWSAIPVSDTVPDGRYVIRIKEMKLALSGEGKLMVVMYSSVDEGALAGVPFPIQNYVLGTEQDPLCQKDPRTWLESFGGRQMNQLLEATGTGKDEKSLRATISRAAQARFQAYVTVGIQKEGEYAGTERNRITKYAPYGKEMLMPGAKAKTASMNGAPVGPGGTPQPRQRQRPNMHVEDQGQDTEQEELPLATKTEDDDVPF